MAKAKDTYNELKLHKALSENRERTPEEEFWLGMLNFIGFDNLKESGLRYCNLRSVNKELDKV